MQVLCWEKKREGKRTREEWCSECAGVGSKKVRPLSNANGTLTEFTEQTASLACLRKENSLMLDMVFFNIFLILIFSVKEILQSYSLTHFFEHIFFSFIDIKFNQIHVLFNLMTLDLNFVIFLWIPNPAHQIFVNYKFIILMLYQQLQNLRINATVMKRVCCASSFLSIKNIGPLFLYIFTLCLVYTNKKERKWEG